MMNPTDNRIILRKEIRIMTLIELSRERAVIDQFKKIDSKDTLAQVDIKYHTPVKVLIQNLRSKMSVLDKFKFVYITEAFSDMDQVVAKLESIGGEIPNGITLTLSQELYGKIFNDLSDEERGIIKILSTYICIVN